MHKFVGNYIKGQVSKIVFPSGTIITDEATGLLYVHNGITPGGTQFSNSGGGSNSSTILTTTITTSGTSQALTFAVSGGICYDITQTANCVLTLSGGSSGQLQTLTLILRQNSTAGWTATLPSGIKWSGGTAPTVNTLAGKIDVFTFSTPDGGTTVFGSF